MSTIRIILPIFFLIILGWTIRRFSSVQEAFWRDLERLIYHVFFPALLFHSLSRTAIDFSAAWPMVFTGMLYTLAGMGLGYLARYFFHDPPRVYAAAFQSCFRFNSYVGLAVIGAMHGRQGIAAIGLLMGFLVPMANVASVAMLARHGQGSWFREIAGNPLIMSTAGGVLYSQSGLPLPALAGATLELLARASLPLGLIAVGAGLRFDALRRCRGQLWYGVGVKLLVLPALAWGLAMTFGLEGLWFDTALLMAALPVSTVAYVLAIRMGADGVVIATQVAITTLLSMMTLPMWLMVSQ